MKIIKQFIFIILIFYVNNQVPYNYSINSCGKIVGYGMPNSFDDCRDPPEFCCFVHLVNSKNNSDFKKFCAIAPSKIEKSDIEEDIESYTGYILEELKCNAKFLNFEIILLLIIFLF